MSYKLLMNRIVIYDTLFFGVKAVAEYPTNLAFKSPCKSCDFQEL